MLQKHFIFATVTKKINTMLTHCYLTSFLKNTTVGFPNVFGKGERITCEYSQGTNNHTDYRVNFNSPINMNPRNG